MEREDLPPVSRSLPFGLRSAAVALLAVVVVGTGGFGTGLSVFGPETYRRGTGTPVAVNQKFRIPDSGEFTLRVVNHGVTSAVISLNGRTILAPDDFTKVDRDRYEKNDGANSGDRDDDHDRDRPIAMVEIATIATGDDDHAVPVLERPVTLRNGDNQISVELRSKPGTWLTVEILRAEATDRTPPTITAASQSSAKRERLEQHQRHRQLQLRGCRIGHRQLPASRHRQRRGRQPGRRRHRR